MCMDGSCIGTVGPDEKPLCKLDSVAMALSQLEEGMVMTKTDDRLVHLRYRLSYV